MKNGKNGMEIVHVVESTVTERHLPHTPNNLELRPLQIAMGLHLNLGRLDLIIE